MMERETVIKFDSENHPVDNEDLIAYYLKYGYDVTLIKFDDRCPWWSEEN